MEITEGIQAPDFILMDDIGVERRLSDYRGKSILLYFYPKDDTPGCTTEACNFRDDYSEYEKMEITIVGISPDTVNKHTKFKEKHNLPFTLLADIDHKVSELYDVWGRKKFMGKEYDGVFRTTFFIDKEGVIRKIFKNVKPAEHSKEVLRLLRNI